MWKTGFRDAHDIKLSLGQSRPQRNNRISGYGKNFRSPHRHILSGGGSTLARQKQLTATHAVFIPQHHLIIEAELRSI